jgi:hypothetical protein
VGSETKVYPFWYLGQKFFDGTKAVAVELSDWFEDPAIVSEWLVNQQERMVFSQPLVSVYILSIIICKHSVLFNIHYEIGGESICITTAELTTYRPQFLIFL